MNRALDPSTTRGQSKKAPATSQAENPHKHATMLATWPWTSQPRELGVLNLCC